MTVMSHETAIAEPLTPISACVSISGCKSVCETCRIRMFAVCSSLADHEIRELEAIQQHAQFAQKSTLFVQGDLANSVYSLTSGTVRLHYDLPDGRRQIVGFAVPGDFLAIALDERFGFTADALTPVTACRFERSRFMSLADRHPAMMTRLHEMASHELTIAQEHMVVLGRRRAEERVACFLLGWWARMKRINGNSPTMHLPMGRQDMADYLGLTIETVSRTLARWMREKIILDVPDGIRVLDAQRLEDVLA
ncbi:Crp cAMP-binding proteins - catabolite gene activator and regulatory subunit of cAMP-dependent protein kinases [Rhabdaerophilaceae bacterium]